MWIGHAVTVLPGVAIGDGAVVTRYKGQCFPVSMRHLCNQPLANGAAPVQAGHIRLCPGLVDKDDAPSLNLALKALP